MNEQNSTRGAVLMGLFTALKWCVSFFPVFAIGISWLFIPVFAAITFFFPIAGALGSAVLWIWGAVVVLKMKFSFMTVVYFALFVMYIITTFNAIMRGLGK